MLKNIPDARSAILFAENLQKTYGSRQVLQGLSFSLHAGRVMGFLGPNGAGKTTSIRILTMIVQPTQGKFFINGIGAENPDAIRRIIGVLPESHGFPERMTAIEYLIYGGRLYGLKSREAKTRAFRLLADVGLDRRAKSLISTFSRGMRQRLGIARALINDPMVVFLDEPTLGLDPKGQQELLALIRRIARERNASVVLCSHLLSEIEQVCDDVIILKEGGVVAIGSVADVIKSSEKNIVRVRVHPSYMDRASHVAGTIPAVRNVTPVTGGNGSLEIEIIESPETDTHEIRNGILSTLIQAKIPILGFGTENGRLQEVFLKLTEGGTL